MQVASNFHAQTTTFTNASSRIAWRPLPNPVERLRPSWSQRAARESHRRCRLAKASVACDIATSYTRNGGRGGKGLRVLIWGIFARKSSGGNELAREIGRDRVLGMKSRGTWIIRSAGGEPGSRCPSFCFRWTPWILLDRLGSNATGSARGLVGLPVVDHSVVKERSGAAMPARLSNYSIPR